MTKIAILSDIHMQGAVADASRSHAHLKQPLDRRGNPLEGLRYLIDRHQIRADVLLCGGDLGDQADPDGIEFAWEVVQDLGRLLQVDEVLATVGNHDVDSRYGSHNYDPVAHLRQLSPDFPVADQLENRRFWSDHFAIIDVAETRFVILNTSAYHTKPDEVEHGRVAERTINRLEEELVSRDARDLNVLLCHHHPYRYGRVDTGDYGDIRGFSALNRVIGSGAYGKWLLVHGHRHWPCLGYAYGGGSAPTVFSAGSLSATVWETLKPGATNQFYVAQLDEHVSADPGMAIAGRFHAWDWSPTSGWTRAQDGSDLPAEGGFGFRQHLKHALHEVRDVLNATSQPYLLWRDVVAQRPMLEFVLPDDRRAIRNLFLEQGGTWEHGGMPSVDQLAP